MSKRKPKSAARRFKAALVAVGITIAAYYKWANGIRNRKVAFGMMALPPVLLLGLIVGSGADSSQQNQLAIVDSGTPATTTPVSTKPAEPSGPVAEATYPVTVTKTGIDFQHTFDGVMEVYPDKTIVIATWTPECGDIAPVDYQTQKFIYTLPNDSSEMKTVNEFSDCMNNKGTLNETDTYRIDPDGTIRVDLVDDDGSFIQENFLVITGGPAPQTAEEPEIELASEPEPEPIYEPEPVYTPPARPVYGTCKDYNAAGYGNFVPGDPEYTSRRDRDSDGIACEF